MVTTNVCVRQASPGVWPLRPERWFRLKSGGATTRSNLCAVAPAPTLVSAGIGGAFVKNESMVVRCASEVGHTYVRHDYCFAPREWGPRDDDNQTAWLGGLSLVGSERHAINFNHFNRDVLFWNRVLRSEKAAAARRAVGHADGPSAGRVQRLVVADPDDLSEWSLHHVRAVLPATLRARLLWSAAGRHRALRRKRELSVAVPPPARTVCFDALAEKVKAYSGDRDDLSAMRVRAFDYCGVPRDTVPSELVLEVRGRSNSTSRRVSNAAELSVFLEEYARRELCLRYSEVVFSTLDYCGQVRAVAKAKMLVGIHGQGLTNAVFLHPDAVLVELFTAAYGTNIDGLGHQPLAMGSGIHYLALMIAEPPATKECGGGARGSFMGWKLNPRCPSHVDVPKLKEGLSRARQWLPI